MSKLDFFQRLDIYDINGDTVSKKTFNAVKELQEQNKILREALEFVIRESGTSANYNKMAREALEKVKQGEG